MTKTERGSGEGQQGPPAPATAAVAGAQPASPAQPADLLAVQRDADYLSKLQQEADFWDDHPDSLSGRTPFGTIEQYVNRRLTGDPKRAWYETISDHGNYRRGCVLGAGPGIVERHLLGRHAQLSLVVYDISAESLARLRERMEEEFPGRVEVRCEDLNFVELPADSFDLAVAQASIHHIVNLEHLAYQINRSLTENGLFFLREMVAESRFAFSEEKKRMYQAFLTATRKASQAKVTWPDPEPGRWRYSPFEAIRSGDILEVFATHLQQSDLRTMGALTMLWMFAHGRGPAAPSLRARALRKLQRLTIQPFQRQLARLLVRVFGPEIIFTPQRKAGGELLFSLDSMACDSGFLRPGIAFATYRKRIAAG